MNNFERTMNVLFFELTVAWGREPFRPIFVLLISIIFFTPLYFFAISFSEKDGIWRVWPPDRVRSDLGEDGPQLLKLKGFTGLTYAFYFSILSAFRIGWRELNVGEWMTRFQPKEYTLRASGWVRTVSGIQSMTSVYLLALAVLAYFGRPFG